MLGVIAGSLLWGLFSAHTIFAVLFAVFLPLIFAGLTFVSIADYALLSQTLLVLAMSGVTSCFLVYYGSKKPIGAAILSAILTVVTFAGLLTMSDHTYKRAICAQAAEQGVHSVAVHSLVRYMTLDSKHSSPYPETLGPLAAGKKGSINYIWHEDQNRFLEFSNRTRISGQFKPRQGMSKC